MAFALAFSCAGPMRAQTPPAAGVSPAFDVASIKPASGLGTKRMAVTPNGFTFEGLSLKDLIRLAYGPGQGRSLPVGSVSGGPAWADRDRYDIQTKCDLKVSQQQSLEMLKTLLAERFQLELHYESKQSPVFILEVRGGGHKMKQRKPDDGGEGFTFRDSESLHYVCRDVPMERLAAYLESPVLARPVIDRTGLKGTFDFDLAWRPDESQFGGQFAGSREMNSDLPDLFSALGELGLRLRSAKMQVRIVQIVHAERPSAN